MYLSISVLNKFKSAYNKCIFKFFGFKRSDSMSGILLDLSLPSVDTIMYNSHNLFTEHCDVSRSKTVQWFATICI